MKLLTKFSVVSLTLVFLFSACNKNRKEQRIADRLEGTWKVTNLVLPVGKKDSSFLGNGNWINLRFDDCPKVNNPTCNMAFTIKVSDKLVQDNYIPVGYTLKGKNQFRLIWGKDTLNFKIEEYKRDKLKLSGMDSAFAAPTNYLIEAER